MTAGVDLIWNTDRSVTWMREWTLSSLARVLHHWGYRIVNGDEEGIHFVRRRSLWSMAFISPLAFLLSPRQKDEVVVTIMAVGPDASRMTIVGELPKRIAAVLGNLPQATRD